ncbi:MAG: hypothetical protein IJ722_06610 [Alloprevotella sp.]|nr:hypothetical protein [Alloprevotella sp.]
MKRFVFQTDDDGCRKRKVPRDDEAESLEWPIEPAWRKWEESDYYLQPAERPAAVVDVPRRTRKLMEDWIEVCRTLSQDCMQHNFLVFSLLNQKYGRQFDDLEERFSQMMRYNSPTVNVTCYGDLVGTKIANTNDRSNVFNADVRRSQFLSGRLGRGMRGMLTNGKEDERWTDAE